MRSSGCFFSLKVFGPFWFLPTLMLKRSQKRKKRRRWRRGRGRRRIKGTVVHGRGIHTLDEGPLGRLGFRYWRQSDEPGSVFLSLSLTTNTATQFKSNQIKNSRKPHQEFPRAPTLFFPWEKQDWHDYASWQIINNYFRFSPYKNSPHVPASLRRR